jgi:hypothetical protein
MTFPMPMEVSHHLLRPLSTILANTAIDLWCTAEMCTAVIVVSLPSLKSLIVKTTPNNTYDRSNSGYLQAGSSKTIGGKGKGHGHSSHVQGGTLDDDEMELTFLVRNVPVRTACETHTDFAHLQPGPKG